MKQKNILWSLLAMMVIAISASFVACGDDDDDDDSGSGVVGTWSGRDGNESLTLTFKSGGSGTYVAKYNDYYSGTETERGNFTYEMEGKKKGIINVRLYDSYYGYEYETFYFMIEGKTMYIYEDDYEDDLEWVLTKQ